MFLHVSFSLQEIGDHYGIDWAGPVVTDEDDSTVTVDDLPDFLSEPEKDTLRQHISDQGTCTLTEESMIRSFTISKVFVHAAANEHD